MRLSRPIRKYAKYQYLYFLYTYSIIPGMQFSQAVCICMSQVAIMKRVQVIYNENVSKSFNTHTNSMNTHVIYSVGPFGFRPYFKSYSGWNSPFI